MEIMLKRKMYFFFYKKKYDITNIRVFNVIKTVIEIS